MNKLDLTLYVEFMIVNLYLSKCLMFTYMYTIPDLAIS